MTYPFRLRPADDLRIALFSGNYNCVADGANNALNHLVGHLLARGAAVRIYSPAIAAPAFAPVGDLVPVPSIGFPGRSEYRLSLGLTRNLKADIAAFAPTHVHVSAPDPHGYQAQSFARRLGIPVITSLHTRFEKYFEFYGLGFGRRWAERYLRRFYARADMVLVPNGAILDELAGWGMGNRLAIWSRGVDGERFDPHHRSTAWRHANGLGDQDIALLFFGRLVREKGIVQFADAVHLLRERGIPVRPVVVGEGPARREFAERLGGGARFLGHLAGDELGTAVASTDILLNPSTTEAFGNVNLEAMASGLAIVTVDLPSAASLIIAGCEGLLVPPGDTAALVDAVAALALDPQRRRALGVSARARAGEFDWARANEKVIEAYRLTSPRDDAEKNFAPSGISGNRLAGASL